MEERGQSMGFWQKGMNGMYEFMQKRVKMSKENAAFLAAALMLAMLTLITAVVISIAGLWGYADTILSFVVLAGGLAALVWMLNLS